MNPIFSRAGLIVLIAAAGVQAAAPAQDARSLVERANRVFAEGKYEDALHAYQEAELTLPENTWIAFNRGAAHYKLGQFDLAKEQFNKALATRDLNLEAKVKYNLGNVAYASALQKLSQLQEAIDLLKQAMGHYRDALEVNPDDADARANIETAQLLIKDLLDKLKQQQEQKENQSQDQQQQEQQQDQNQPQESSSEDQQEQEQQDGDQEQQEQQGEQKQQEQPSEAGQDQQQQQKDQQAGQAESSEEQPQQARQLSEEEAERLLQAVRDKERQRRDRDARHSRARRPKIAKDW